MARKESISAGEIINAAFTLTREEGLEQVTARHLAAQIGCSTQPIFRVYKSMEDLYNEIYEQVSEYFSMYYEEYEISENTPFVNLGMVYISFAQKEPNLFKTLFLSPKRNNKSLYELLNADKGAVKKEIANAGADGVKNPGQMFMKMWIFIHGAACMAITGDYDLTTEETRSLLKESYESFR